MKKTIPIVAVLGHVDHGKTSLLDAIRKTDIASREVGQITQGIGASQIEVATSDKEKVRKITFIDTPGHEAFLAMRSRGVAAADIAILVVSAAEGVKPQTIEAIKHIKTAKIPFIVALTKSDLPTINTNRVKQELHKNGVELEEFGGKVPVILTSVKTGQGIKELLELTFLVWDMSDDARKEGDFSAVVIESKLDPKRGVLPTLVIKSGEFSSSDTVYSELDSARVKAIFDTKGKSIERAGTGDAVEILGFKILPNLGELITKKPQPKIQQKKSPVMQERGEILPIILRADNLGSLETIKNLLPQEVFIVSSATGPVGQGDILLAKSNNATIITFNLKTKSDLLKLANIERVIIREYNLVHELMQEIADAVESLKTRGQETILGQAQVLATFPYEKTKVLGVKVLEGRLALGDKVRLERGKQIVGTGTIKSMKKGKEEIKVVNANVECGIIIEPLLDFATGDMVLSYKT